MKNKEFALKKWFQSGVIFIYLNAAAASFSLILVFLITGIIAYYAIIGFMPKPIFIADYKVDERVIGEFVSEQKDINGNVVKYLVKVGNREVEGLDFRWLEKENLENIVYEKELFVAKRREWGNLYGTLISFSNSKQNVSSTEKWNFIYKTLEKNKLKYEQIEQIEKKEISSLNYKIEKLKLKRKRLSLDNALSKTLDLEIKEEILSLEDTFQIYQKKLNEIYTTLNEEKILVLLSNGEEKEFYLSKIIDIYRPNHLSFFEKASIFFNNIAYFLVEEPREANTEGGVFPAIFGTVLMVILMSILVTPLGVLTAIYLREYAKQNLLTRIIRVSVNNLAGVPSIVYGVFGLGFFIYTFGGSIDKLFYYESLPSPTFGTGGILWASLTLALLTVPVVIVSAEEGISRIPRNLKEGSLALGATKIQTIFKIVLPMASPSIMTGIILAVARAAGEVAPLMLVGVVKLAPSFPIDGNFPFFHLERKFMHLGFHIYDLGFQSPNVEASRPLLYATALLLILIVIFLNSSVILIRNHLREKYKSLEH